MTFMLDVRRLRVLLAIAEHGGVASAARALAFTPPAVSQHVAALERQLDIALVDRTGRSARLTPEGERLAEHARKVLADLEAAEADLATRNGGMRGVVRIGVISTLGRTLLPLALAGLATSAPGMDFRIVQGEPEDTVPALARGDLDIVLAGEYGLAPQRSPARVRRIDLFTEPVLIGVDQDHRLTGTEIVMADLQGERWIAPAAGSSCEVLLMRSCALAGYEPHVVAHCADFDVAMGLVAIGHGITLVPSLAMPATHASFPVRLFHPTSPQVHRTLYAAIRDGTHQHPLIACVLDTLAANVDRVRRSAVES